jgi:hypothetical protein
MMMPPPPSTITPLPVLRQNWKTLARLASRWSKPLDVDVCSHTVFIRWSVLRRKPINLLPLGFEAQTKKPSWWFCGPNHQIVATGFEAKPGNPNEWFWGQTTTTIATGFEAKPGETVDLGFEAELKNPLSLSPCARCRPHIASLDLSIVQPPSTQPVLVHPRSSAPSLLLLPRS